MISIMTRLWYRQKATARIYLLTKTPHVKEILEVSIRFKKVLTEWLTSHSTSRPQDEKWVGTVSTPGVTSGLLSTEAPSSRSKQLTLGPEAGAQPKLLSVKGVEGSRARMKCQCLVRHHWFSLSFRKAEKHQKADSRSSSVKCCWHRAGDTKEKPISGRLSNS